jgi:hypothetical protein
MSRGAAYNPPVKPLHCALARHGRRHDGGFMHVRARIVTTCLTTVAAATLGAQPLDRSSGRVAISGGSPAAAADVRAEAAKAFAAARDLTRNKDERGSLSAAIGEMNKARNVMKGMY